VIGEGDESEAVLEVGFGVEGVLLKAVGEAVDEFEFGLGPITAAIAAKSEFGGCPLHPLSYKSAIECIA
jgi:hypothetical protein